MAIDVNKVKDKLTGKNKNELMKIARDKFGQSIELTDNIDVIRDAIVKMFVAEDALAVKSKVAGSGKLPDYYLNPETGHVFDATLTLHSQINLVPCNKDGDVIRG